MAAPLVYLLYQGLSVAPGVWERLWRLRLPGLLLSTLALAGTVSLGALSLGLLLAWLMERTDLPGRKLLKPLLLSPLVIPCYLVAIGYAAFFGVGGLLEKALRAIFNNWQPFIPDLYGFGGAALVLTLATYPYVYVLARAALGRLDPTLEEAARCLGVGRWRIFWRVTLPLLSPALSAGGLLCALYALSDFGVVTTLRYPTFVAAIYQQLTGRYDQASAAALSTALIALTLLLLWAQGLVWGRRRYTPEKLSGRPRPPVRLGLWRWPALAMVFLILGGGLLLPLSVLGYWLVEGWLFNFNIVAGPTAPIWGTGAAALVRYTLHSFTASAVAATLAVLLALPLAYWTVRHRDLAGQGLAWAAQAGQALPGVLIALALAFILYRFVPALYFTAAAVVLAYLVRFFPQALQAIRAGLAQVPARLEEGARLLGYRPVRAFCKVTLPLLWPTLGAGWTLVFLNALRELPATLLLRPAGFDTLPVRVWIAAGEGFYAQAAPAALLLIGLSLPLLFLLQREAGGTIYE